MKKENLVIVLLMLSVMLVSLMTILIGNFSVLFHITFILSSIVGTFVLVIDKNKQINK